MNEDEEFEALEQRLNMKETKQPEALRLAKLLEQIDGQYWQVQDSAAAELRRLHALCQEMLRELYVYRASEYLKDVTAAIKAKAQGASNE